MRDGMLPNGMPQPLYFPTNHPTMPNWFKGMEQIIRERGLWPEGGLLAQCHDFKCPPDRTDCCCRRILFTQPDFANQKPYLQEFIESHGHLCDFYPKYHCELNFIKQYWGAAKLCYHVITRSATVREMEKKMQECLDEVPLLSIRWYVSVNPCLHLLKPSVRFANRLAQFIHAYGGGLTGAQAAWANWKYHGHRTLPPELIMSVKSSIIPY